VIFVHVEKVQRLNKYKLTPGAMHSRVLLLVFFSHAVVFSKPLAFFLVEGGCNFTQGTYFTTLYIAFAISVISFFGLLQLINKNTEAVKCFLKRLQT
jgi:hypothetical protein